MRYVSTRGGTPPVGFSDAVALGLAPDGGLFVPERLPDFAGGWRRFEGLPYAELAAEFLGHFATDVPPGELRTLVAEGLARFRGPEIAPLRPLGRGRYVLELFHGPTLAFKDFALQLLGRLYARQCRLRGESINALGATSGDTGSAAIHGLLGTPGAAIFILYPDGLIAPLQERQMACTGAGNVHPLAIRGTFDDAQALVKDIFGDQDFRRSRRLAAVNSINLARILAQCVYYLHAWLRLPPGERERAEFVVPTGNFGNVLAGWMLKRMGVPIPGFKVATNQNDVLYRYFTRGDYRPEPTHPSLAPSMDIQAASNFERFLYFQAGEDPERVRRVLAGLRSGDASELARLDRGGFTASRCTDAEIPAVIRRVREEDGYLVDPHTACAFRDLDPGRVSVILATASPAKFPDTIRGAVGIEPTDPILEALKGRPIVRQVLPADAGAIKAYLDRHAA
jgi:threonine synthase